MAKKRNQKNKKSAEKGERRPSKISLPEETKKYILGVIILLLAAIVSLSFFDLSGIAGKFIIKGLSSLIGKAIFAVPLILVLSALVFFLTSYQKFLWPVILAVFISIFGISGILESLSPEFRQGGYLGDIIAFPFLKLFGFWVTEIILGGVILISSLIFWHLLKRSPEYPKEKGPSFTKTPQTKQPLIKRIFGEPKFQVKEVVQVPPGREKISQKESDTGIKPKPGALPLSVTSQKEYKLPVLDLLDSERGAPTAGDIRVNSSIIKKTLENFSIPVEMSDINIGPTVTQYTLKPADGIKLSKITTLSNDLSLALASHPIRIEAPIPGKPLVGIEVPNKVRAKVRLKDLIADPQFENSSSNLVIVLGKDVSGNPIYADLSKMPHLLVAGSTGTGKTIFLNSLIISLLYRNSPSILRFILIDPKRVEFPVYQEIPHLLCPVILEPQKTVNALKWLVSEMERRFGVLAAAKTRDIAGYNELAFRNGEEPLPYIVLIVDELADVMAARGRDVEAGIVRLAQMARAVGIHLVLATQRPSVEVITGLIKANITSRVTFQVASQVDSRTVLDMAGAEKLLGLGDLLFVSAEIIKPKRVQGAYVSEKEVKRVVNYITTQNAEIQTEKAEGILENHLAEDLERTLEAPENEFDNSFFGDDPLYEEAKRVVIEARKASASLLQRRLRLGYARAARLIDMLEERGVVGPGEGAKPREILMKTEGSDNINENNENNENGDWQKL